MNFEELHKALLDWAKDHNLLDADPHIQFSKIVEELGETSAAYNKHHHDDLLDSVGDLLVTISIFCHQLGIDPVDCLSMAYEEIAGRTGKTINGSFVKDADLHG